MLATTCASLFLSLSGCKTELAYQRPEPKLLIDSWWNVDYAKNACEMKAGSDRPCIGDPTAEVKNYELQISTKWAADPMCHGLRLLGSDVPRDAAEDKEIDFQMMLDYVPGESRQSWTVTNRRSLKVIATGNDGPEATAHTLCAILNHKGGSVE